MSAKSSKNLVQRPHSETYIPSPHVTASPYSVSSSKGFPTKSRSRMLSKHPFDIPCSQGENNNDCYSEKTIKSEEPSKTLNNKPPVPEGNPRMRSRIPRKISKDTCPNIHVDQACSARFRDQMTAQSTTSRPTSPLLRGFQDPPLKISTTTQMEHLSSPPGYAKEETMISLSPRFTNSEDEISVDAQAITDHFKRTESEMEFLVSLLRQKNLVDTPPTAVSGASHTCASKGDVITREKGHGLSQTLMLTKISGQSDTEALKEKLSSSVTAIEDTAQADVLKIELMLNEFRKCKEAISRKIQQQQQHHHRNLLSKQCEQNSREKNPPTPNSEPQNEIQQTKSVHPGSRQAMSSVEGQPPSNPGKENVTEDEDTQWNTISATMLAQTVDNFNDKSWPGDDVTIKSVDCNIEPNVLREQALVQSKSMSFFQPPNLSQYERIVKCGENGFPTGLQMTNPFLSGANSAFKISPMASAHFALGQAETRSNPEPIRINVSSKELPRPPSPLMKQQFGNHVLERNLHSLEPRNFQIIEPVPGNQFLDTNVLRKPIAVSMKYPPDGEFFQNNLLPPPPPRAHLFQVRAPADVRLLSLEEKHKPVESGNGNGSDTQRLGDLLNQLPVLSREQKVEEFRTYSRISAHHPHTSTQIEEDSKTSIVPVASSSGTNGSSDRLSRALSTRRSRSEEAVVNHPEMRGIDPNSMSMHELVSLGKKIYRILSELSTGSSDFKSQTKFKRNRGLVSTPIKLNIPTPNTPMFVHRSSPKVNGNSTNSSPTLLVDFSSIPNPTFITGPAPKSNVSKLKAYKRSSIQLKNAESLSSRGSLGRVGSKNTTSSLPGTYENAVKQQKQKTNEEPTQQNAIPRNNRVLSLQLVPRKKSSSETFKQRSSRTSSQALSQNSSSIAATRKKNEMSIVPPKLPESFSVQDKFRNNYKAPKKRQLTQVVKFDESEGAGTEVSQQRPRSRGGRNFIAENISKVKMMGKLPDSRLSIRPLPPVKKRYENVPSRIAGSKSRSNSRSFPESIAANGNTRYRSSSMPMTNAGRISPSRDSQVVRSVSTPRPSTGLSVHVNTPTSRSPGRLGSAKSRASHSRENSNSHKTSIYKNSVLRNSTAEVPAHKSRSKTRRVSQQRLRPSQSATSNSSSRTSHSSHGMSKGERGKRVQNKRQRHISNMVSSKIRALSAQEDIFNTPSEKLLIKKMVQEQMNQIVDQQFSKMFKDSPARRSSLRRPSSSREELGQILDEFESASKRNSRPVFLANSQPSNSSLKGGSKGPRMRKGEGQDVQEISWEHVSSLDAPRMQYEQTLFSIERWMNPDGELVVGASKQRDTPPSTAMSNEDGGRTVRFSLPSDHRH